MTCSNIAFPIQKVVIILLPVARPVLVSCRGGALRAYYQARLADFLETPTGEVVAQLHSRYANDGFFQTLTSQARVWDAAVGLLKQQLALLVRSAPITESWFLHLEYPLYRLGRRIDAIVVTGKTAVVLELKDGVDPFSQVAVRQVEEYALDLRDFHSESRALRLVPVIWATSQEREFYNHLPTAAGVTPVQLVGVLGLRTLLERVAAQDNCGNGIAERWGVGEYRPVPAVIDAATTIFRNKSAREITQADASNLAVVARRVVDIIENARRHGRRVLVLVSGVPGSGKTLTGLEIAHDQAIRGQATYLSGNGPLVTVLREALARNANSRDGQSLAGC